MSYSSGTCPTVLGHVLQFWDMSYSSGTCPTVLEHVLQFWNMSYCHGTCPTVLRHVLCCGNTLYVLGHDYRGMTDKRALYYLCCDMFMFAIPLSGVVRQSGSIVKCLDEVCSDFLISDELRKVGGCTLLSCI